ncbi:hypothetical protein HF086_001463 [Spodoptera exigua]|uniref:SPARC/Testican calcium-binding domain-containing protein n=1 Tax=Spodoptera exigua TaxID=7107 RepID=A0A922M513_SPOEX|nr:hypothetical protein HF086_001463 [Spodoptera exigua]
MFAHLDTDGDGLLSAANLYALRHDERERCLRPFLASCGGAGAGVARAAWCGCLRARGAAVPGAGAGAGGAGAGARGTCRPATRAASTGRGSATPRSPCAGAWTRTARSCPARAPRARPPAPVRTYTALAPRLVSRLMVCHCLFVRRYWITGEKSESVEGVESAENEVAEGEEGAGAAGDAEGAPADDEDGAGSGDAELHF